MTTLLIHTLLGFFAIMNPIGNAPVFLGLAGYRTTAERRAIALRGVGVAFFIVSAFVCFGHLIFTTFGITLPAFRIAGGLLLFSVGYELLHARKSQMHHPKDVKQPADAAGTDVAISPLAIPILAGPGTISTGMKNPIHEIITRTRVGLENHIRINESKFSHLAVFLTNTT